MKINLVILIYTLFCLHHIYGNDITDTIEVSSTKNTILIFDSMILVDYVGSDKLDFMKDGNRYLLKAVSVKGFPETNLYIETETGKYNFVLIYNNSPKKMLKSYDFKRALFYSVSNKVDIYTSDNKPMTTKELKDYKEKERKDSLELITSKMGVQYKKDCERIIAYGSEIKGIGKVDAKIIISLSSMYVKKDKFYFCVNVYNRSNIGYDFEDIKIYVMNSKGNLQKRAQQQEVKLPIYTYNENSNYVSGKGNIAKVFMMDKFTMSEKESLYIEIREVNGDRTINFKLTSKQLFDIKILN